MDTETVKKLAELSRLSMNADEQATIAKDLESVLQYVDQLTAVDIGEFEPNTFHTNVMREDVAMSRQSEETKKLVEAAGDNEERFIKVQNIL